MNEIILSPERDFLNPRNPSSPFQYKQAMCEAVWDEISNKSWVVGDTIGIVIQGIYFFSYTKDGLFKQIMHHWGL